ncbi:TRAP transporter permease [Haloprofundus salinisoli]|uniref:TRAP transporter permease n=1 Tax=Haloprofundus salinisoli TaxID=2876193 RepID=UPI001CCF36BF|nr:TRAP transporter fused permease subunit [Haloprofundus salinisoli]
MAKYGLLIVLGVLIAGYHLGYVRTFFVEQNQHRLIHIGTMTLGAAIVAYEVDPQTTRQRIGNYIGLLEGLVAIGVTYYLVTSYERMVYEQLGIYTPTDMLAGVLMLIVVFDVTRRVYGPILSIVGLVGLAYAYWGPYFPGILNHNGISLNRLIQGLTIDYGSGLYGVITGVSATYIIIFMILAGLLEAYGALDYFIQLGTMVGRRIKSGLAQMTVVASLGMGSINGSAAANAATTGAFTIPLLKRHGLNKNTASAFESVASSGGQIMPPIMGAAAFVMAQITGNSYLDIIVIGALPALLFYFSVAVGVHLTTMKEGIEEIDMDKMEVDAVGLQREDAIENLFGRLTESVSFDNITVRNLVVEGLALWIPVAVLLFTMIALRWDPLYAGFWAVASSIPAAFVQSVGLRESYGLKDFGVDTLDGFGRGLENAAPIGVAIGVMNVFVGVLNITGFTQVFANSLLTLSGGVTAFLLVLTMVAALLFGLGMPTVAAYITAVLLIAPALAEAGIPLLAAHFFVFYFAILSAITPPVAIACLVTSRISGGSFWETARRSLILAAPLFILPYVFVLNDSLLFWAFPTTASVFLFVLIGFIAIAVALVNYLDGPVPLPIRAVLLVLSMLLLFAPLLPAAGVIRVVAAVLVVSILVWQGNLLPDSVAARLPGTAR